MEGLKPGYCLTSLSEATRKLVDKPPKAQGAAEGLKPGYCPTSLSEATRKLYTGQAPDRWPQTSGKLPKAPVRALRSV